MLHDRPILKRLAFAVFVGWMSAAHAQVHKCANAQGGTVYSQAPCASAGLRDIATLKVEAPPPDESARARAPLPAGGGSAPAAPRARVVPPGVDDPLGDPLRPRRCADQQQVIDAGVAAVKQAIAERSKAQLEFDRVESEINQFNASPNGRRTPAIVDPNRYERHRDQDAKALHRVGLQRIYLSEVVQQGYSLKCHVIARPLRLQEAEQLQSRPVER